jgi:uncharacterized protein
MTGEGHGPDPGSDEWWAACERFRARRGAPSFDCAKASGRVEALICSDPELAALDVELARPYRAVSANMKAFRDMAQLPLGLDTRRRMG